MMRCLVLDGASGTLLEELGVKPHPTLWSAIALVDDPEAIKKVHKQYFDAGANVTSTVTYQASFEALETLMDKRAAAQVFVDAVRLAREAAAESAGTQEKLVAGSLGPYGAFLSQGQEYSGDYGGVSDQVLYDFHFPRIQALLSGKPDILLLETIPRLQETKVLMRLLDDLNVDIPVWVSFSVRTGSEVTLADGSQLSAAVDSLSAKIGATGANCFEINETDHVLKSFRSCTTLPLLVYPNSGEVYDGVTKTWASPAHSHNAEPSVESWYDNGARIIGGCCRSRPLDIAKIAEQVHALGSES